MLEVTKKSIISGKTNTMELDITQEDLAVFPQLSSSEREFLISGITPTEWNDTFGEEENDDDHDA
jgi:hypothetical protein